MAVDNSPTSPHIVLIRGLVRSRFHWLDFPQKLQQTAKMPVECVELAGNGFRCDEDTPSDINSAVQDLRNQVKHLTGKLQLVGISLGGMLATAWAQRYPDEVASVVLINSSSALSPFYQRLQPKYYAELLWQLARRNPATLEEFVLRATINDEQIRLSLLTDFTAFQKKYPVKSTNFVRQLRLASQVDFRKVPQPKQLLLVAEADRLVSPTCSETVARTWNCSIERHPRAGHDLTADDPDWVAQHIADFLFACRSSR